MNPFHLFKMTSLAVGALMVGAIVTNLPGSPVPWMQMMVLDSWGVPSAVVQASQEELNPPEGSSLQIAKGVRPATKAESPEDAEVKQLPPAVPPGQLKRPSKAEMLDKCMKNPSCRAKVQAAKQKGPNKPRPAAREESPEEKALKQLPEPVPPKARRQHPRSEFILPNDAPSLLSWLNPFQVAPVYAQSPVSIFLTPAGPAASASYMYLYGARVYNNNRFRLISTDPSVGGSNSENKPYAFLRFQVPATGTYLINVEATRGKAKMRHLYGGPIIDTWDFTSQPYGNYDYLTAEYLEQGPHYFYFWPDGGHFYIYSASLESY